eukprot:COSAG01_NODE_401_length_17529_cov_47.865806_11_plen_378_part_00
MSAPTPLRVLHLVGSATSNYYEQLSVGYARECVEVTKAEATQQHFTYLFACVHPSGEWSFPTDLSEKAAEVAPRLTQSEALAQLVSLAADVVVPHMFCYPGMTTYRSIFDLLGTPMVGCPVEAMAISTNKARTRAVISAFGARVAKGEVLRKGENLTPTLKPPFMLKPCSEDNSMGITLVEDMSQFEASLAEALKFDDEILVEEYIPLGRELRVGVLEDGSGHYTVLPAVEYHLPQERPIRTSQDKLKSDADGNITGFAPVQRSCPADVSGPLFEELSKQVIIAHKALGCRDYSLYDVRVSPDGVPYILEAGLYCSFAERSIIVLMSNATGDTDKQHLPLFCSLVRRAASRHKSKSQNGDDMSAGDTKAQCFGMKAR